MIESIEDSDNFQSVSVVERVDQVKHVKIKILKGYNHFVAVYKMSIS
jgi:hypothetical protein